MDMNNSKEIKSIVKLKKGRLATLCTKCRVIISTGNTGELYCEKCYEQKLQETNTKG